MRFTWTFLAGAALLGAFAMAAQIQAQNPAAAPFSSAPNGILNPIEQLPPAPRPGSRAPLSRPTAAPKSTPKTVKSAPKPTPIPTLGPRFSGQNPIRVGLSTAGSDIKIYFPGGATLWKNRAFSLKIPAGEVATVAVSSGAKGQFVLQTTRGQKIGFTRAYFTVQGNAARVTTNGGNPKYGRPYRGDLEIFPQKLPEPVKRRGPLALVNVLPLEAYLKGVVPWEMAPSAPLEALKAQAICARTKALDFVRSKRFAKGDFEICDYDSCQGYPGMENEKPATTQAVDATKGLAIYHNNRPIDAVYSTNSGGITANARDVWPSGAPIPYLQSVVDVAPSSPLEKLWQSGMTEAKWAQFCAQDFDSFAKPVGVSNDKYEARKYRWNQFVSVADAAKAFAPEGFGAVTNLEIVARAPSGRIKALRVSGFPVAPLSNPTPSLETLTPSKTLLLEGDGKIRAMFSKRLGSTTALASSLFTLAPSVDAGGKLLGWNLQGAGWGHGVGMCQRGAQNHAKAGWDARRILNWYYRGVQIR